MFGSSERIELATLWCELIAGSHKVESWAYAAESWSMVIAPVGRSSGANETALRERDVAILEQALLSGVRKHVAVEVGLSCSSIAVIMQSCFQFMGLPCVPSRIPGLLVAAAHARYHLATLAHTGSNRDSSGLCSTRTIVVPRPDRALAAWLAPAEHAVVHLLVEGLTYAEIAEVRRTSIRTVANQVASAFRRLDVSGRAELLCLLARWGFDAPARPTRSPRPLASTKRLRSRRQHRLELEATRPRCPSPGLAT